VTNSDDVFRETTDFEESKAPGSGTPVSISPAAASKKMGLSAPDKAAIAAEEELSRHAERLEVLKELDIDLIEKGDIIKVFPGERIPTDGEVVRGLSYVDESLITGMIRPVICRVNNQQHIMPCNSNNYNH
jgi:P-type E1-E2 ATPase